jgi:WD40 repeat protein
MRFPKLVSLSLCSFTWIACLDAPASAQQWSVPLIDISLEDPTGILDRTSAESVKFMPDGKLLVTAGFHYDAATKKCAGELCLRKVADGSLVALLHGTASSYSLRSGSLAVGSTGKLIAAGGSTADLAWIVDVFDAANKKLVRTLKGDPSPITCLAFSPDAEVLAVAHLKGTVELWNLQDGTLRSSFVAHQGQILAVAFSPKSHFLATGSAEGSITFWNAKNCKKIGTIPPQGDLVLVAAIAFSPDGKFMAYAGSPVEGSSPVYLWQILQAETPGGMVTVNTKVRFDGHRDHTYSVAFSPASDMLASANQDGTFKIWDTRTNQQLATIARHTDFVYDVAFSPDGTALATVGRDSLNLWTLKQLNVKR